MQRITKAIVAVVAAGAAFAGGYVARGDTRATLEVGLPPLEPAIHVVEEFEDGSGRLSDGRSFCLSDAPCSVGG